MAGGIYILQFTSSDFSGIYKNGEGICLGKIKLWTFFSILLLTALVGSASSAELDEKEQLGKNIFFDKISDPDSMSCADCHAPKVGFTGPIAGINNKGSVYRGAVSQRFGDRKPPSAAYATLSPVLHTEE